MLALVAMSFSALVAKSVNTLKNSFFAIPTDTAINGYDTVAYFTKIRLSKVWMPTPINGKVPNTNLKVGLI